MSRNEIEAHTIIFIRNDVYELLVEETPDRGKESKAFLDWTDQDLLREMLRRRLVYNGVRDGAPFKEAWLLICASHIEGEETSQYMIDRCLMRPRCLLDIVNYCRSVAVNLKHRRIEPDDILKGILAYSTDLVFEIGLEIRDILPEADRILYRFVDAPVLLNNDVLTDVLSCGSVQLRDAVVDNLLWYGFLGIVGEDGRRDYIYSVNYDMNMLNAVIQRRGEMATFCINPAFWPGLRIDDEAQRIGR